MLLAGSGEADSAAPRTPTFRSGDISQAFWWNLSTGEVRQKNHSYYPQQPGLLEVVFTAIILLLYNIM